MDEVPVVVGEGDRDLRERLDQEIIACNVAVTGYRDVRLLSVAIRGDGGDLQAGLSERLRPHPPGQTAPLSPGRRSRIP